MDRLVGAIWRLLTRQRLVASATALAAMAVTAAWAYTVPPQYTTTAVVSLSPRPDAPPVTASLLSVLSTRYVALAASPQVSADVAADVGVDVDRVRAGTEVTLPERTTNVTVSVTMTRPATAQAVADALVGTVVSRATSDPLLEADVVVPARAAPPSNRARYQLVIAGFALSAALGVAAASIAETVQQAWRSRRSRVVDVAHPL